MGAWRIAALLGGEAWDGECSGGSEVKTLGSGFIPQGFVLLSAVGGTAAEECLLSLCGHQPLALCALMVPSLVTTEVLVKSRCPLLACGMKSLLSLGMLCCSPSVGLSLLPVSVADRNQTPHSCVDFSHQQPAGAGI